MTFQGINYNNCGLLSNQWIMSLDVTAHLCNDKQLIFKMLFFSFSSYCGEGEEGA